MATTATAAVGWSGLEQLPTELFMTVTTYLTNGDIKNLRLVSRGTSQHALLRLNRVFLSANPRNVEVFLAIANHETFRKGVTEIVWDDAQFPKPIRNEYSNAIGPPYPGRQESDEDEEEGEEEELEEWEAYPRIFETKCEEEMESSEARIRGDADPGDILAIKAQLDARMSLTESWEYYRELRDQQDQVIETGADEAAFRYGLTRFPLLRRITITPAAHGRLFYPIYETPMIRAFPRGFTYPIPRGWPMLPTEQSEFAYRLKPWNAAERDKAKWRGFCIVTRQLASLSEQDVNVVELVLDANHLHTGLNAHIFEESSEEYDNFVKTIGRPGFARLDLDLLCELQVNRGWPALSGGRLKRALSALKNPDSVSLRLISNLAEDQRALTDEDFISLAFLPINQWQHLKHFGLSRAFVRQKDVLSLLLALPDTLRSVELSFLIFDQGRVGGYQTLVEGMRDTLTWNDRIKEERPKVIIRLIFQRTRPTQVFWDVSDAVTQYIYGERDQNPFRYAHWNRPDFGASVYYCYDASMPNFKKKY